MPRPRLSQHADTHFVRACAVEMHFSNISQETSEEPLYTEFYRKNAAPQLEPRTQNTIRATLYGNLQDKCRTQERGHPLCASLHVKI